MWVFLNGMIVMLIFNMTIVTIASVRSDPRVKSYFLRGLGGRRGRRGLRGIDADDSGYVRRRQTPTAAAIEIRDHQR